MEGKYNTKMKKIISIVEVTTVSALHVLILISVLIATVILYVLFTQNVLEGVIRVQSISDLLPAMQTIFAGILVVLLGLELAETLKAYFAQHEIRVEVILIVAIVAVGRHMIQIDFAHTTPLGVFGLAALMLSLTIGYYLVKRTQGQSNGDLKSDSEQQDK